MQPDDLGFSIHKSLFSPAECEAIIGSFSSSSLNRTRAGLRHLMSNSAVAALATDSRLISIAKERVGMNPVPFRATLFEKIDQANWLVPWHQDTALPLAKTFECANWGPWSRKGEIDYAHAPTWALSQIVALRLHIDASTSENGPLRVIPRSHFAGVLSDDEVLDYVQQHASMECLVPRGGVLAMSPLLIHSSSKTKNAAARRVLHIEYAESLHLNADIQLAIA